jgi:catechol 2,3-dioxygenase-like lactoylglutathione lyase family enzyme
VFDHVTLRVGDVAESRRSYDAALAPLGVLSKSGGGFDEWGDLSITAAGEGDPRTQRVHVAIAARSHDEVDAFWRAATEAGFRDNGPPGIRERYHADYYGAFVLDPDGNNIEAVNHGREPTQGMLDHVSVRVADAGAARDFYETVLAPLGLGVAAEHEDTVGFGGGGSSFWLGPGDPSTNVHVAFAAAENATVDEWHRVALAAGYRDNGAPGERGYHPGYYAAFVLDPDGNNVEAVCHNRD